MLTLQQFADDSWSVVYSDSGELVTGQVHASEQDAQDELDEVRDTYDPPCRGCGKRFAEHNDSICEGE